MMRTGARGFSLVEVLIGLFLITVAILAAAPLFIYAARVNAAGAETGSAAALAAERLEMLRVNSFDALVAGGSLTTDEAGYVDRSNQGFVVRWRIADGIGPGATKLIEVRAEAERDSPAPPRQITLRTKRAP